MSVFPNPLRRARLAIVPILALALALCACSLLPAVEPVDIYRLPRMAGTPAAALSTGEPPLPVALRIHRPAASPMLAGQRIVVGPDAQRLSVYPRARWSEAPPMLVRNRLLDALRNTGRFSALSTDDQALIADIELMGDLRRFQAEHAAGQTGVVILLDVRLVRADTRRIIASRRFEARIAAHDASLPRVVDAFGQATDQLVTEVSSWVFGVALKTAALPTPPA